ncbi:MAG: hypothetical protein GY873_40110, partial [Bosea sp.]|uniref:hypothetical protein n=1 Tax=Bosea sp. (in: a-proteobacteria) TaxID=1871050 RepID=UPI002389AFB4|nr:hypothetical protein [Bosea sp. (in: a-proteobacteria)]
MNPQRRDLAIFMVQQQQNQLINLNAILRQRRLRRRRQRRLRKQRALWCRPWIGRRMELGLYDRLLVELQNESPADFHRFMRMPQAMYQEIVTRLTPRLQKQTTNWRQPLEPGLKIAITLRHL